MIISENVGPDGVGHSYLRFTQFSNIITYPIDMNANNLIPKLEAALKGKITVKDMTKVVEHDEMLLFKCDEYLQKNLGKAFIFFNTPITRNLFLEFSFGSPFIFFHNDNYYAPTMNSSVEKAVESCLTMFPGFYKVCSICMEDMNPDVDMNKNTYGLIHQELLCGHSFHVHCIAKWRQNSDNGCPVCRDTSRFCVVR